MQCRYLINLDKEIPKKHAKTIVIGSGIAGLYTAFALSKYQPVTLITKKVIVESNTNYAQGGIAAVISEEDSPELHFKDTIYAGAGLCYEKAVSILANEGGDRVRELIELGAMFDTINGELALAKEGAHSLRRILRAKGDATGAEIVRALVKVVLDNPNIEILENHYTIDVVTNDNNCKGVLVQNQLGETVFLQSDIVVLATGGMGQLFRYTTNPEIATGDGVAMAYRAGARLANLEFYQFHPTVLSYPGAPRFLISEAVRGEGALLRNIHGERFMLAKHEMAELAPRDVVSRSIVEEMERTKATYVFLDITDKTQEELYERFPTIYEKCLQYGLDISHDWIPVAPAAHYAMGGIMTNEWGETNIGGLFACGEVASTGIHGANRLASNSLSEAIVYGKRIADKANEIIEAANSMNKDNINDSKNNTSYHLPTLINKPISRVQHINERRLRLQKIMLRYVGVKRDKESLLQALDEIKKYTPMESYAYNTVAEFEFMNMLTCATLTTTAAVTREESRGAHYRTDFPDTLVEWQKPITIQKDKGVVVDAYDSDNS